MCVCVSVCLREGRESGREEKKLNLEVSLPPWLCACAEGLTAICVHVYAPLSLNLYMFE